MQKHEIIDCDSIVIGAGMGGMTVASLLARDGWNPVILEAAHVPGGCSSSFTRKGYTFESGATTLIGFDEHQPLSRLEAMTGISIPREEIDPGMTVHLNGQSIIRFKDRKKWMLEAGRVFGNPDGQRQFWSLAFRVSDFVWRASARNIHFPPQRISDILKLAVNNSPLDVPMLRYAYVSVYDMMMKCDVATPEFTAFVDEQLMITAQATTKEVPFLFGAAGITYTNYSNFYVPGGLLEMIRVMEGYILKKGAGSRELGADGWELGADGREQGAGIGGSTRVSEVTKSTDEHRERSERNGMSGKQGAESGKQGAESGEQRAGVRVRHKVVEISREGDFYLVRTERKGTFRSRLVYSNLPVWNMTELASGELREWFLSQSRKFEQAWGAFTMGIVTSDEYPSDLTLHHQIHLDRAMTMTGADSLFVSMSRSDDRARTPAGFRTLNISCHTPTDIWFNLGDRYDQIKQEVEQEIIEILRQKLPGFAESNLVEAFGSTPVTWQNWVYRKKGRVGGIPQSMSRALWDWTPAQTPYPGLYLCGDTVYPGQGIPGVTLSGINVYYRSEKFRKTIRK